MARIRTIKPEFPHSENIGRLSRDARLLFVLLWTWVDDHGRARGNSRLLAANLFPYDDDVPQLIDGWLSELLNERLIRIYEIDGSCYLDIPSWSKHQRIDNAGKSHIPEFRGEPPQTAENVGEPPLYLGPRTIGPRTKRDSHASQPKRARARARTPIPENFMLSEKSKTYAQGRGFVDGQIVSMAEAFENHHRAKGNLMADWEAAWRTWVNNEIKFQRNTNGGGNGKAIKRSPIIEHVEKRIRQFENLEHGGEPLGGGLARLLPDRRS
jgi:hypothetical protein